MSKLYIQRDVSGALVHLRRQDTQECVGCIEAGLFDLLEQVWREQVLTAAEKVSYGEKAK